MCFLKKSRKQFESHASVCTDTETGVVSTIDYGDLKVKSLRLFSCVTVVCVGVLFSGCQSGLMTAGGFASNFNSTNKNLLSKNFRPKKNVSDGGDSDVALYGTQLPTKREIETYRKQHPAHLAGYRSAGLFGARSSGGSHENCNT